MLSSLKSSPPVGVITSDASGSWGCGAFCGIEWFQLCWNSYLEHSHILVKELTSIVIAAAVWGINWFGQSLLVQSDDSATVAMVNSGVSHNSEAMHLLRCLSFIAAKFQLSLAAVHIPGEKNTLADALSHNVSLFYSLPTGIPPSNRCSRCTSRAVGGTASGLDLQSVDQSVE